MYGTSANVRAFLYDDPNKNLQFEERIYGRNPDGIYENLELEQSISLYAWKEITKWRAEKEGSVLRKSVAELGYLGSGIFSILEMPGRMFGLWMVGNQTSHFIAKKIVGTYGGEVHYQEYLKIKKWFEESCIQTVEAVGQNFTSIGTNAISHQTNLRTAKKVKVRMEKMGENAVKKIEHITPVSVALSIGFKSTRFISTDVRFASDDPQLEGELPI